MKYYGKEFYKNVEQGAQSSAREILPIIEELISPRSVIDIGCGNGAWLAYFYEKGIKIKGVDGDYVDRSILKIPAECFFPHDLTQALELNERYDLAMSYEVAEHLEERHADLFIKTLTSFSDVIAFSAAIPHARSTSHFNEQWQSYWALKFAQVGYNKIDCIRHKIWSNPNVEWWYAQDILLYANSAALKKYPALTELYKQTKHFPLDIVHPRFFIERANPENYYLVDIIKALPKILRKIIERKLR